MNRTVYFADKAVAFTAEPPGGAWYAVAATAGGGISRDKILNFLESHNTVAVVSDDPDGVFAAFAAEFTPVEAAGGVVVNDCGEWLMIHRNGRWDLPKGHLESGGAHRGVRRAGGRGGDGRGGGGRASPVRDAACLLFSENRALGTETNPLVRTAYARMLRPDAPDRGGSTPRRGARPGEAAARAGDCYPTVRTVLDRLRTSADVK